MDTPRRKRPSPRRRQKTACGDSSAAPGPESRELAAVRTEDLDVPLARHHYSLGVVAGSLALVLHAGTPLRRVAAVLAMTWSWAGVDAAAASYVVKSSESPYYVHVSEPSVRALVENGRDAFLQEPPTPENFVRVIRRILLGALTAGTLDRIRLREDPDTWVDLYERSGEEGPA